MVTKQMQKETWRTNLEDYLKKGTKNSELLSEINHFAIPPENNI